MLVEQPLGVRGPHGPGALAVSGNGPQLDVTIAVLQERNPLSVWRPERHRLVPPALDHEPDFLRLDIEHADVHMVVDVRDEGQLPTVRRPGSRPAEVPSDRVL